MLINKNPQFQHLPDYYARKCHESQVVHIHMHIVCSAPSHDIHQCCLINWTLRNTIKLNLNQDTTIFAPESAFENVIYKMVVISSRPQSIDITADFYLHIVYISRSLMNS